MERNTTHPGASQRMRKRFNNLLTRYQDIRRPEGRLF